MDKLLHALRWLMVSLFGRLVLSVLGVVTTLAVWTLRSSDVAPPLAEVPAVILDGTSRLEVSISVEHDSLLRGHFATEGNNEGVTFEKIVPPGATSIRTLVPLDAYGILEVRPLSPVVGERISWTVALDGQEVIKEEESLKQPLGKNESFFVQLEGEPVGTWKHRSAATFQPVE